MKTLARTTNEQAIDIMKKEIQVICVVCVGNPDYENCGEVLNLSTEHETVCPSCGTVYTAECARRQAVRPSGKRRN